jgi:hypothetical protein
MPGVLSCLSPSVDDRPCTSRSLSLVTFRSRALCVVVVRVRNTEIRYQCHAMPYTMLYRAVAEEYVVPDPKRQDYTHLRVAYIIMRVSRHLNSHIINSPNIRKLINTCAKMQPRKQSLHEQRDGGRHYRHQKSQRGRCAASCTTLLTGLALVLCDTTRIWCFNSRCRLQGTCWSG